jgi:hypothetical protein
MWSMAFGQATGDLSSFVCVCVLLLHLCPNALCHVTSVMVLILMPLHCFWSTGWTVPCTETCAGTPCENVAVSNFSSADWWGALGTTAFFGWDITFWTGNSAFLFKETGYGNAVTVVSNDVHFFLLFWLPLTRSLCGYGAVIYAKTDCWGAFRTCSSNHSGSVRKRRM